MKELTEKQKRLREIRSQIRGTRREMKEKGIKRISCFNGGHSPESYRLNALLFRLEVALKGLTVKADES